MKYVWLLGVMMLASLVIGCGRDDDDHSDELLEELADVCVETDEVADEDTLSVESPESGSEVGSPLVVSGNAIAPEGVVWIRVLTADDTLVDAYPAAVNETEGDTAAPFEASVPFTVFEPTAACVWVYLEDVADPVEAVKVPVRLLPSDTPTATQ